MKTLNKIVFLTFFLLITMGITGGVTPLYSQSFNVISGDTIKYKTDLKTQYRYTYVYLNEADSVGEDVTDSTRTFGAVTDSLMVKVNINGVDYWLKVVK